MVCDSNRYYSLRCVKILDQSSRHRCDASLWYWFFLFIVHACIAISRAFFGYRLYAGRQNEVVIIFGESWSPRNTFISTVFVMAMFVLRQMFWQIQFPDKIRLISLHGTKSNSKNLFHELNFTEGSGNQKKIWSFLWFYHIQQENGQERKNQKWKRACTDLLQHILFIRPHLRQMTQIYQNHQWQG